MSDHDYHFPHESISDFMRRNRQELYKLTVARDYGFKATSFVIEQVGEPKFFEEVGRQRAQARLDGNIVMDEQGNERFQGTIDLTKLGLTAEQIATVETLRATEKTPPVVAAPVVAAPVVVEPRPHAIHSPHDYRSIQQPSDLAGHVAALAAPAASKAESVAESRSGGPRFPSH